MRLMHLRPAFRFPLLLLAICAFLDIHSNAQHMNAPEAPCQRPASTAGTTVCFIGASKAANEELERVLSRVSEVLSKDEQKDLQEAQRLWLEFRNATCSAERNLYGRGSGAPGAYAACIEAQTRQRSADLKTTYGWLLLKFGKTFN